MNLTIKGDGFIFQVYPSNSPPKESSAISSIDLGNCELILRREYNISPEEPVIIAKYDIIDSSSLINQIEYKVYSQKGNPLDISLCNGVNIDISYPLNSTEEIDLTKAQQLN